MLRRGFTLVEVMVVVTTLAIMAGLLLGTVHRAREAVQKTSCLSNLRQIGIAIAGYSAEHEGKIPYGPQAGGMTNAGNFYSSTGAPTSLISMQSGQPCALGLLLDTYLARNPRVLFCPGTDQAIIAEKELAKVGHSQAQSGYYYRHGGNTELFDFRAQPPEEPPLRLGAMGENRKGQPIRALVMDTICDCTSALKSFGATSIYNHRGTVANVLYTDGHVAAHENADQRYTVDLSDPWQIKSAYSKILAVFEKADAEP